MFSVVSLVVKKIMKYAQETLVRPLPREVEVPACILYQFNPSNLLKRLPFLNFLCLFSKDLI